MDKKSVLVSYPKATSSPLKVVYKVSQDGNMQTIECAIDNGQTFPEWLQLKRFDFVSLKSKGIYDLLFEESKYNKNLDTLLFLDQVYEEIMRKGSYPIN